MRKNNLFYKLYINSNALYLVVKKLGVVNAIKVVSSEYFFDLYNKVDTITAIDKRELSDESSNNINEMTNYRPSLSAWVDEALTKIKPVINFKKTTFIDMGSGKGKVLFVAEKYPFIKVKGIEYSRTLHDICEKNIKTLKLGSRVQSYCMDATDYYPEPTDSIFYFFNPFTGSILHDTLTHITETNKSPIYLIVVSPSVEGKSVDIFNSFAVLKEEYRTKLGGAKVYIYKING